MNSPSSGLPRLPVDRVFTMKGFGTVATGTLVAGVLRTGDTVTVLPGDERYRIRGLQVHGASVDKAVAGQRTAVEGVNALYPAFDITPPHLIAGIITDRGIYPAHLVRTYFK
jgi:selenocysteine-specific elongation factor